MTYTTTSKVRTACGIESGEISDADVALLITDAEKEVDRLMNTTYDPKTVIERMDSDLGVSPERFFVSHFPILRIIELKIDQTSVSPKYLKIYRGGKIEITEDAEKTQMSNDLQDNIIKYSYADFEISSTSTETTNAVTEADDVSISVSDSTGIITGNYVQIEGMDGYSEIALVSNVADGTHITASISLPHESGSIVTKMEIPQIIVRLTDVITSLMLVARLVGSSYDEIVGYDLDGLHVQKGEPYTQWRETALQLRNELKTILATKRSKSAIV
jgi:hypothetical protein